MTMVWREVALLTVTYPFCIPTNRDCFIENTHLYGLFYFEIQRTLYSNNRNYVLTYANNKEYT